MNFRNKKIGKHIKVYLCLFVLIAQFAIPFIHTWQIAGELGYNTASKRQVSNFTDTGRDVRNEILRSETGQEPYPSNHNPNSCIICQNLLQPNSYVVTPSFSASFIHPAKTCLTANFTFNTLDPNLFESRPRAPPYFS